MARYRIPSEPHIGHYGSSPRATSADTPRVHPPTVEFHRVAAEARGGATRCPGPGPRLGDPNTARATFRVANPPRVTVRDRAAICSPLGTGVVDFVMPWSPRHNQLRFALEHGGERMTVLLAGELDCASAPVAHLALERAGQDASEIVLDLSRVVFLDAAGLRFLISAQRRARAARRQLIVRRPSRSVRRMIDLTGAAPLLSIEDPDPAHLGGQADGKVARILDAALDPAMRITQADLASAQLAERTSGALRLVAQRGLSDPLLDYFEVMSEDEPVCGAGLGAGQPVWIPDLTRSAIVAETPALDVLLEAGVRALACIPIRCPDGQLLARLAVHHRLVTNWTQAQMAGLEELGHTVAEQCRSACLATPGLTSV